MLNKQTHDKNIDFSESPWKEGPITFPTPSGKLMQYQPYSNIEQLCMTSFGNGNKLSLLKEEK